MIRVLQVRKRDGRLVPFRRERIAEAIYRAARAVGGDDRFLAEQLAGVVSAHLERAGDDRPSVEDVQDTVERVLIETGHARTAKAYILYRDRRAAARAARRAAERGIAPLHGGDARHDAQAWSKREIAESLVEADGLERVEAEDVARAVEERVLRSGLPRFPASLVTSLIRAEMFDRGYLTRLGEDARVGVSHEDVSAWLEASPPGRRAQDPSVFAEALGEEVLAHHALDVVLPPGVAEAHRLGDVHAYDLGATLSLTSLALPLRELLDRHLADDTTSRAGGPRRLTSVIGEIVRRYRPYAARCLALEDLNVFLAPYLSHLDGAARAEEIRELLLSAPFSEFPGRGGLRVLEVGLAADVPARLRPYLAPAPAPPGRTWGDYGDAALETARAIIREHTALRREGWDRGPALTLVVPRRGPRDPAARALIRQALGAAAETGDPLLVFEDERDPSRGSRWLRVRESAAVDPLRFAGGDVTVATVTALNVAAAAHRVGAAGGDALRADLDRQVRLAVEGVAARRAHLVRHGDDPAGTLYPLGRGPVPLVDLEGARHVLEPVGLARAVVLLEPDPDPEARARARRRILLHLRERAAAEGGARGLVMTVVEGLAPEIAGRMARLDVARFGETACGWEPGREPSYAVAPPATGETRREPAWPEAGLPDGGLVRVRHRVNPENRPALDAMLASVEALADDGTVAAYALEPWPRRLIRNTTGPDRT